MTSEAASAAVRPDGDRATRPNRSQRGGTAPDLIVRSDGERVVAPAGGAAARTPRAIRTRTGTFEFAAHNCFGCGTLNVGGLGLDLHVEPGRCWAEATLDRRFEGWEGVIHGGIIAAVLDEVMAWALVGDDDWGVTAKMTLDFRRRVTVGQPIRATGWVTKSRRRIVETASEIVDPASGTVLASATGLYVAAGSTQKRDLRSRYALRPADNDAVSGPPADQDAEAGPAADQDGERP